MYTEVIADWQITEFFKSSRKILRYRPCKQVTVDVSCLTPGGGFPCVYYSEQGKQHIPVLITKSFIVYKAYSKAQYFNFLIPRKLNLQLFFSDN